MKSPISLPLVLVFLAGAAAGIALALAAGVGPLSAQSHNSAAARAEELTALAADVERLKQVVPDQAHAMQDVDYHFNNLWFAANQGHWPLAQF